MIADVLDAVFSTTAWRVLMLALAIAIWSALDDIRREIRDFRNRPNAKSLK